MRVGIRELKNRLSEYVDRAREGAEVTVTDRGRPVAVLRAASGSAGASAASDWVANGIASWAGGKPRGCGQPPHVRGGAAARCVLEDRR